MEVFEEGSSPAPKQGDEEVVRLIGASLERSEETILEEELKSLLDRSVHRIVSSAVGKKYRDIHAAGSDLQNWIDGDRPIDMPRERKNLMVLFYLGCRSDKAPLIENCTDCIHRLIDHGYIGGHSDHPFRIDDNPQLLNEIVSLVCMGLNTKNDGVYLRMVQALLSLVKSSDMRFNGHGLLSSVRTIYNVFLNAQGEAVITSSRTSLNQVLDVIFSSVLKQLAPGDTQERQPTSISVNEGDEDNHERELSAWERDSYLLFRALGKLANKMDTPVQENDPTPMKSRILALELLDKLVVGYPAILSSSDRFVYGLRHHLAPALINNGMSAFLSVANAALDTFDDIVTSNALRPLLKDEIVSLFEMVVFRYIKSGTVTPQRRRRSVSSLKRICTDPNTLVEMFINYDCDINGPNCYENVVRILCGIIAGTEGKADTVGAEEEQGPRPINGQRMQLELKLLALEALGSVFSSMRTWGGPLEQEGVEAAPRTPLLDKTTGTPEIRGSALETKSSTGERPDSHSGVLDGDDNNADQFEATLIRKKKIEESKLLFNQKPNKGVRFLLENDLIEATPDSVARFLMTAEGLDATAVGEYLGDSDQFNLAVMAAYTDLQDFSGVVFDEAIRQYLANFRLPGEAQKIDRIMQKFAARFCECNPQAFSTADTGYVLAYSVIMLNTDLHNPQVKNKMSMEGFIRNNRGINDGEDLPSEMLASIYNRIVTKEIRISGAKKDKRSDDALQAALGMNVATSRARMFKMESDQLLEKMRVEFARRKVSPQSYVYYRATNVHHARIMVNVILEPVSSAMVVLLQAATASDASLVNMALEIFEEALGITSSFGMEVEYNGLVQALESVWEQETLLQLKHIRCMRLIVSLKGVDEGEDYRHFYSHVVRSASMLELAWAIGTGSRSCYLTDLDVMVLGSGSDLVDPEAAPPQSGNASPTGGSFGEILYGSAEILRGRSPPLGRSAPISLDNNAAKDVIEKGSNQRIEVLADVSELSLNATISLCGVIAEVALAELDEMDPRSFCLRKIMHITDQNMQSRTMYQWTKIWEQLSKFFCEALSHKRTVVALKVSGVLTHLAAKFLEKDELSNYSFQRAFLNPFERAFSQTTHSHVKETILLCIRRLVQERASNMKSGWKSIFNILAQCASEQDDGLVQDGFEVVKFIIDTYLGVLDDVFVISIGGIVAYINNKTSIDIARKAVDLLSSRHPKLLVQGQASGESASDGESARLFNEENNEHVSSWFPILLGLSANVISPWPEVVSAASSQLFSILELYGGNFTSGLWTLMYRGVLMPMFDDVDTIRQLRKESRDDRHLDALGNWVKTIGKTSLMSLSKVLLLHYNRTSHLIPEWLQLVRNWTCQEFNSMSRDGIEAMRLLAAEGGGKFAEAEWDSLVEVISTSFRETMPYELLWPINEDSSLTHVDSRTGNGLTSSESEALPVGLTPQPTKSGRDGPSEQLGESAAAFEEAAAEARTPPERHSAGNSMRQSAGNIWTFSGTERETSFRIVRAKCVTQLLLIDLTQEIVEAWYLKLKTQQVLVTVDVLWRSYEFAHKFNASVEHRFALWRAGFMNHVPNLLKQEAKGMLAMLRILMWMYQDTYKDPRASSLVNVRLHSIFEDTIRTYSGLSNVHTSKPDDSRELLAMTPVVGFILECLKSIPQEEFRRIGPKFFDLVVDLADNSQHEVRAQAARVIRVKYGQLLGYSGQTRDESIPRAMLPKGVVETALSISGCKEEAEASMKEALLDLDGVGGCRTERAANADVRIFVYGTAKLELILARIAAFSGAASVAIL